MSRNDTSDDEESTPETGTDRRSVLEAAGGLAGFSYLRDEEGKPSRSNDATGAGSTVREVETASLDLGGTHVVGVDGYATIAEAWEAASSGDTVYVHSSYDAEVAGERFPVVLDYEQKEVALTGGHPSGSVIDASHTDENVIEVLGRGMNDYRNNPLVRNLKIVGGDVGLRVRAAPYSSYRNLVFYRTGGAGVSIEGYTDPDSGREKGTFGASFYNCQAWSCGGDGFTTTLDAMAHDTKFTSCIATWNKGHGFDLRGYTNKVVGGTTQLNEGYGVRAKYGKGSLVQGVYVEGNARDKGYPLEIYGYDADGLTVEGCYFNGITPSSTTHDYETVLRGINVHGTNQLSVRDCTVRNYGDGFVAAFDCADPDVHAPSHHLMDDTDLLAVDLSGHGNVRPRSDGAILPMDLSNVEGAYEGDRGYHVGRKDEGPAVWRNGRWHLARTKTL